MPISHPHDKTAAQQQGTYNIHPTNEPKLLRLPTESQKAVRKRVGELTREENQARETLV
jgi:hypothetical protein